MQLRCAVRAALSQGLQSAAGATGATGARYPLLHCARCNFEISGEDIQQRHTDLLRPPAKTCCVGNPARASRGTLVNFVEREAVVMELVEHGLTDFASLQQQGLVRRSGLRAYSALASKRPGTLAAVKRRVERRLFPDREGFLAQRVVLLQKLYLMVQLAEAVAWLHGDKRIVHWDLAPDNVMVHALDGRRA